MSSLTYTEKEKINGWSGQAELIKFEGIHDESFDDFLDTALKLAIQKKQNNQTIKNSSSIITILRDSGIPVPVTNNNLDNQEITGLIGEIISEDFLNQTTANEPFYIKWKENGTSKSNGIDMIFFENNELFLNESKHLHEQLKNTVNYEPNYKATIQKAFESNSEYHSIIFLARLYLKFHKARRVMLAGELNTDEITQKIDILRNAIRENLISTNTTIITDNNYTNQITLTNIVNAINYASFPVFTKLISAFLTGINDLETRTDNFLTNGVNP